MDAKLSVWCSVNLFVYLMGSWNLRAIVLLVTRENSQHCMLLKPTPSSALILNQSRTICPQGVTTHSYHLEAVQRAQSFQTTLHTLAWTSTNRITLSHSQPFIVFDRLQIFTRNYAVKKSAFNKTQRLDVLREASLPCEKCCRESANLRGAVSEVRMDEERLLARERHLMEQIRELDAVELPVEEVDEDHDSDADEDIMYFNFFVSLHFVCCQDFVYDACSCFGRGHGFFVTLLSVIRILGCFQPSQYMIRSFTTWVWFWTAILMAQLYLSLREMGCAPVSFICPLHFVFD